jgi:hypothetical protein
VLLWSVCRLRHSPEDLPYSIRLLLWLLVLDTTLGMGSLLLDQPASWWAVLVIPLLSALSDALVLLALLRFKRRDARYVQALTAIYGCDFLLGLIIIPLQVLSSHLPEHSAWLGGLAAAQILVLGWSLGVRGFVYHRSLGVGLFQGNMLSLTLFMLNVFMVAKIFPELLTPA